MDYHTMRYVRTCSIVYSTLVLSRAKNSSSVCGGRSFI